MERIAVFKKVSFEQFMKDFSGIFDDPYGEEFEEDLIHDFYDYIKLPERKTRFSAGHDFFMPYDIALGPGESEIIPTGIRCSMSCDWVLMLYPRSSLGMKYHMQLANTVGVIDSDYYYAENEGHIMAKITNGGNEPFILHQGDSFIQGVFVEYGVADGGINVDRTGGFGSTGK